MGDENQSDLAVIDYYDIVGPIMQQFWDDNFHFGYWNGPDDLSPVAEATDRFTDLLIGKLNTVPGDRVLDLGCGIGKPALRLVRSKDVQVVGITISKSQVEQANDRARRESLTDRATFQVADGTDMPFEDDSFDAVFAFESILHMDRGRALREICRVLKPTGRLVATDLVERASPEDADRAATPPSAGNATFTRLPYLAGYRELLTAAGLEPIELVDLTDNTVRISMQRMMSAPEDDKKAFDVTMDPARQKVVAAANMPLSAAADLGCALIVCTPLKPGGAAL